MAQRMGLIGKKIGMTQVFAEDGERIPVTAIACGPCVVVGKRTPDKDKYSALQIGFGDKKASRTSRPESGQFAKNGLKPMQIVREIRLPADEVEKFQLGEELKPADIFEAGRPVDVTSTSKGKGYQGVMKRHNMGGSRATHGCHEYFRHGGSIGCRLTPGRVHKGKRMAGQMGNERVTVQNLQVVQVLPEENVVLVRGAVPGAAGSYLLIKRAAKKEVYRRRGVGAVEERSKNPLKASKAAAKKR